MEIELGNVQAHTSERLESYQQSDRENKELTFQIEEDEKKNNRQWKDLEKSKERAKLAENQILLIYSQISSKFNYQSLNSKTKGAVLMLNSQCTYRVSQ